MAGMALSGLASGFDWKGIVDQLIEVSRAPQNRMRREKAELATRTNALNEVRSSVSTLKSSVGALATESALLKKAATIANPDTKWKVAAATTAVPGEYNIRVTQTATAGVFRGKTNIGSPGATPQSTALSALPLGRILTPGFFMIDGQRIDVALTDSLDDGSATSIAQKIIDATAAGPNPLDARYDTATNKFVIASFSGDGNISFGSPGDTTNFLQLLGMTKFESTNSTTDIYTPAPAPGFLGINSRVRDAGVTSGNFVINGQTISISQNESLNSVFTKIRNATNGQVSPQLNGTAPGPLTVSLSSDSPPVELLDGTSNFLSQVGLTGGSESITRGVRSTGSLGVLSTSDPLGSANLSTPLLGTGSGAFYINGVRIDYDLDPASGDNLQDILDSITNSEAGVTATFDRVTDSILLTSKNTGALTVSITKDDPADTSNTDLDTQGLVDSLFGVSGADPTLADLTMVSAGRNALFSLNGGGTISSNSNTLDEIVHGVSGLTVDVSAENLTTSGTPITEKITVRGDSTAAREAVSKFITDYNALQAVIEKYTKVTYADGKVTAAVLAGSREMAEISRSLRQELYRASGGTGSIQRLADLGVTTSGIESTISLSNSALLESRINTAASDVMEFFTNASTGLIARLNARLGDSSTEVSAASGKIGLQLTSIQKQNTSLDRQIAEVERRLESQRALLESSFIAMEKAQSRMQQQSSYLQRTFAGNSK
jgi:flagellar hook-associated protein 2